MSRFSRIVIVLLVLAGACGGDQQLETDLRLNEDPQSTLLTVTSGGGFVPVEFFVNSGPYLILTRGGELITQGPMIEIYPGPLMSNWLVEQLDSESILFVLEELDALGIAGFRDEINDEAASMVADAPTTTLTFFNQDGPHSFSVYALGIGEDFDDPRVPILANLVNRLGTMGTGSGSSYLPERLQVVAAPGGDVEPELMNERPWPLNVTYEEMSPLEAGGAEWRCAAFEGEEVDALLTEFGQANQATRWATDQGLFQILVRPLFPGENPCT